MLFRKIYSPLLAPFLLAGMYFVFFQQFTGDVQAETGNAFDIYVTKGTILGFLVVT